jgi:hypothetical protein
MNYEKQKAHIKPNKSLYGFTIGKNEMNTNLRKHLQNYDIENKVEISQLRKGNIVKIDFKYKNTKTPYRVHKIIKCEEQTSNKKQYNIFLQPFDKRANPIWYTQQARKPYPDLVITSDIDIEKYIKIVGDERHKSTIILRKLINDYPNYKDNIVEYPKLDLTKQKVNKVSVIPDQILTKAYNHGPDLTFLEI